MPDHFPSVFARIQGGDKVQDGQPDEVTPYGDEYYQQEHLHLREHSLICQGAEIGCDIEWQDWNEYLLDEQKHYLAKVQKEFVPSLRTCPERTESKENSEYKCGHYSHNRLYLEVEHHFRQFPGSLRLSDAQQRKNPAAYPYGEERGAFRGQICDDERQKESLGGVALEG